jgi:predicted DCC family thiol-disulfide oxidoreductase YuxK
VKTEMTENKERGEIGYDAGCRFCLDLVRRWRATYEPRGYRFTPLQEHRLARRLGLRPGELPPEMKLFLADGRLLGGAEAWTYLLREVAWLWPLGAVLGLPGVRRLTRRVYRWVAANRTCLGDACALPLTPRRHITTTFFESP